MSDDLFDPYHKWLGIRDKQRPPNHYRLLGLEAFEDDADVISAAADQRIAHVRTYQLGPHSVLSQKILNELAAARVCLLDPSKRSAYNERLRTANDSVDPQVSATPAQVAAALAHSPKLAPEPIRYGSATADRRRSMHWSVAGGLVISAIALVTIATQLNPSGSDSDGKQARHTQPTVPQTAPRSRSADSQADQLEDSSRAELADSATSSPGRDVPLLRPTRPGIGIGSKNGSSEPVTTASESDLFRPNGATKRWANLATELPIRLRESWGARDRSNQPPSQLVLCHEIAQLAYANLAVAALTCPATNELDHEISRALSKIDEYRAYASESPRFSELFSSVPAGAARAQRDRAATGIRPKTANSPITPKSWQDVDRCFEAFAAAASRLNAILRNATPEQQTPDSVTQQVKRTELLFRTVLAHVQTQLDQLQADERWMLRLNKVEADAMIDSNMTQTGLQQVCHWTLRLCEALCVYCECVKPDSETHVQQIARRISEENFESSLEQLRGLLLFELELWSLINDSSPANS